MSVRVFSPIQQGLELFLIWRTCTYKPPKLHFHFIRWFFNVNIYFVILKLILVSSNSDIWWSNEIDNFILLEASPFQRRDENKFYTAFDFLATRKLSWLASTNNNCNLSNRNRGRLLARFIQLFHSTFIGWQPCCPQGACGWRQYVKHRMEMCHVRVIY